MIKWKKLEESHGIKLGDEVTVTTSKFQTRGTVGVIEEDINSIGDIFVESAECSTHPGCPIFRVPITLVKKIIDTL